MTLKCPECGTVPANEPATFRCPCGGLLGVAADIRAPAPRALDATPLGVWRYRQAIPVPDDVEPVTLGEGGTGLHDCPRMAEWVGVRRLLVKNEGENPTGSFKDRGMTVGMTLAKARGARVVGCASTGNTAASLAAYAARAGMEAVVIIPSGKIALGKLAQSLAHGARVLAIDGSFDDAMRAVFDTAERGDMYLLNSVNPYRLEGQKTLAYEVVEQLGGRAPGRVVYPVGNAGNISAGHKGFAELHEAGHIDHVPRMSGVQAAGASPLAAHLLKGSAYAAVSAPETVATAIRIGNPVNWKRAKAAITNTKGAITTATDDEILEAQLELATREGILVEPASATPLAGLRKLVRSGEVSADEEVVVVTTGHGLKDPDVLTSRLADRITRVPAEASAIRAAIRGGDS